MHKCEQDEKNTTDPWKILTETGPLSLIINGDKSLRATDHLLLSQSFIFISMGDLQVSVSLAKSAITIISSFNEKGMFSEAAWHVKGKRAMSEWEK